MAPRSERFRPPRVLIVHGCGRFKTHSSGGSCIPSVPFATVYEVLRSIWQAAICGESCEPLLLAREQHHGNHTKERKPCDDAVSALVLPGVR